jgi:putative flippase GtrA
MARDRDLGPLLRFLVVGSVTVLVDAAAYAALTAAGVPAETAKAASFVLGAVFAYFANWRFTFGNRRSRYSELLFVVVYALALGLNVLVNAGVRALLGTDTGPAVVAFLAATGVSAVWNFVGMSLFVFHREVPRVDGTARR